MHRDVPYWNYNVDGFEMAQAALRSMALQGSPIKIERCKHHRLASDQQEDRRCFRLDGHSGDHEYCPDESIVADAYKIVEQEG